MFESSSSPGLWAADEPPESDELAIRVSAGPAKPKPYTHRYQLRDDATGMAMEADITLPTAVQVGEPAPLSVKVLSVGDSPVDDDAAEDFYLLLRDAESGQQVRLDLLPRGPLGGTGSSRKPKPVPATLRATWTPEQPGRYVLLFGFRYTDDSHGRTTKLRPRQDPLVRGQACITHLAELLFTQHMHARTIYLGYEAAPRGKENVQELALAEMAAFSGGGGVAAGGTPQAKYRTFFKNHPQLFGGWQQTAPAVVLFAAWGPNPLSHAHPAGRATIHEHLAATHRTFVALVDANLPESAAGLSGFEVIYLESPGYDVSPAQWQALRDYVERGGLLVFSLPDVAVNGQVQR